MTDHTAPNPEGDAAARKDAASSDGGNLPDVPTSEDSSITEYADPGATLKDIVAPHKSHPDLVRKRLAYASVVLVGLAMAGGFIGWIFTDKPIGDWATFTTPVFTLAGVALAFYFSERR
ncbi:hypothetical protein EU513_13920 [Yimella sp. RIT 621]|uniref:hypothetical protein n=1 Tax=Yimella sp. RIT 621 TaxID=2510323 RepID=UPI00101C7508|nr:hypothetical protein [Yimella sp. RIT 621]RYG76142.1 hypothetical protein EU513_13920 [Yimella sp. RIT 621]